MEKALDFQNDTQTTDTTSYKGKLLDTGLCKIAYYAHHDYHWKDKEILSMLVDVKGLSRGDAKLVLELAKNFSEYIEKQEGRVG